MDGFCANTADVDTRCAPYIPFTVGSFFLFFFLKKPNLYNQIESYFVNIFSEEKKLLLLNGRAGLRGAKKDPLMNRGPEKILRLSFFFKKLRHNF